MPEEERQVTVRAKFQDRNMPDIVEVVPERLAGATLFGLIDRYATLRGLVIDDSNARHIYTPTGQHFASVPHNIARE